MDNIKEQRIIRLKHEINNAKKHLGTEFEEMAVDMIAALWNRLIEVTGDRA